MARVLQQFPPEQRGGSAPVYPWHLWLDGQIWELVEGEDFRGSRSSFRNVAYVSSSRRGIRIETSCPRETNTIVIQAVIYAGQ